MPYFKACHTVGIPPQPAISRISEWSRHSLALILGLSCALISQAQTAVPIDFPAEAQALSAQQLKERLGGHSFKATLKDGTGWRLQFKGKYVFADISSGARDSGTWRIEEGKLCTEYQRFPSSCSEIRGLENMLLLKRASTGEVVRLEGND
jgi:hypothetical protein